MREREEEKYIGRQELFMRLVTPSELSVIHDLIFALDGGKYDGLRGVHWVMFLAGDFADSFDHLTDLPRHIDLRLVIDAPTGSHIQEVSVGRMEQAVDGHLRGSSLKFMQRTGNNWHMGRVSFDPDCHDFVRIEDELDRHNDIRFTIEPNETEDTRRIDIVINRIEGRNVEDQIRWETETRHRKPVILFDSQFPRSCKL